MTVYRRDRRKSIATMILSITIWLAAMVAVGLAPPGAQVVWTVRLSLAYWFAGCLAIISGHRLARLLWTLAWLAFVIHVIAAFHHAHGWSHADAYRHAEEESGFGGGVFVSYAFTLLWTADVAWWWVSPGSHRRRPRRLAVGWHAFTAFLVFNATVVYEAGATRWVGVVGFVLLASALAYNNRMKRVLLVVLLGGGVLLVSGLLIMFIPMMWSYSDRARCQNNLRLLGAYAVWHPAQPGEAMPANGLPEVPAATVFNAELSPTERMSWHVTLLPALEARKGAPAGVFEQFRPALPWDAEPQAEAIRTPIATFLCPAAPAEADGPALTQYVGIAGLGGDAATLPFESKKAGPFRYDSPTPLAAFTDGRAHTIMIAETNFDLGPWAQGGPSTTRGIDPEIEEYLGPGRPFAGLHKDGGYFGYADGSARFLTDAIDPAAFRAQVTIAGD